ncbi:MAG: hypothetical protein O3C21_19620, partial [Verrucomicrobia bacterium]|nr:hypothetical protein [Verrucomicrobiota bacterium]
MNFIKELKTIEGLALCCLATLGAISIVRGQDLTEGRPIGANSFPDLAVADRSGVSVERIRFEPFAAEGVTQADDGTDATPADTVAFAA